MKTFPNTEFYLINYFPGSSGTFLQTLMALIYYDATYYTFSKNGNAIGTINHRFLNERFDDQAISLTPIYKNVLNSIPIDSKKPVFSRSHEVPDLKLLYFKYPKCSHIVIQIDETGKMLSYTQDFIKNFRDQYRMGNINGTITKWKHFSEKYFYDAESPEYVPDDIIREYAVKLSKYECIYPYDSMFDLSDKNITNILLTDIHFNPTKILSLLSNMLNKPITNNVIDYYNDYLVKQRKVYNILNLGYSNVSIDSYIHN